MVRFLKEGRNRVGNRVFLGDIRNGFDSFLFSGAQRAGAQRLDHLNPQTQENYLR